VRKRRPAAAGFLGVQTVGKYDGLAILKKTRARVADLCSKCGSDICPGVDYYKEHIQDRFLQKIGARKFCAECFQKHGDNLLKKHY
jgi:hypothetical protein